MYHTQKVGSAGEEYVCTYLSSDGFQILEQNFTTRTGEVDIIAQRADLLVFVEVKTRLNEYFHSSLLITKSKQRKIISAAKLYLLQNRINDKVCRFDVALVARRGREFNVDYIPNAFQGRWHTS